MECTFVVGQKVVCVDNLPRITRSWAANSRPILGATYTVAQVGLAPHPLDSSMPVVWLEEISNQSNLSRGSYLASRFRPLVTTKTDISLFQKILEEASKEAKEKV